MNWSTGSQLAQCPKCNQQVTTVVDHSSSCGTWFMALLICLLGLWAGCCFVPFCVDSMKTTRHYCPMCQSALGEKKFIC